MKKRNIRWSLIIYDIAILLFVDLVLLGLYRSIEELSFTGVLIHSAISLPVFLRSEFWVIFTVRFGGMAAFSAISVCYLWMASPLP